jgi:hypothetical protein
MRAQRDVVLPAIVGHARDVARDNVRRNQRAWRVQFSPQLGQREHRAFIF